MGIRQEIISLEQRMWILSKTYSAIDTYFAHWEDATFSQHQLDEVYQHYLNAALGTDSRFEFTLLMKAFIARLRNAHSWYVDRSISRAILPIGFTMRLIDAEWMVHRSDASEFTPGDVIKQIQHRTVEEWFSYCARYVGAKNEIARQSEFQTLIPWFIEEEVVEITAMDAAGRTKHVMIDRTKLPTGLMFETQGKYIDEADAGYIWIPSFNDPKFERRALEFYQQYKHAKTMIIDVRDNAGGSTPIDLMQALLNVPWTWWTERASHPNWMFKRHGASARMTLAKDSSYTEFVAAIEPPQPGAYDGNVILLTDRCTHSAAEDFTAAFKSSGRALVIGERTAGSTGMPYMYSFDDETRIAIGSIRSYLPDGTEFEGLGIEPDLHVAKTKQDYVDHRDPVLGKALEVISQL